MVEEGEKRRYGCVAAGLEDAETGLRSEGLGAGDDAVGGVHDGAASAVGGEGGGHCGAGQCDAGQCGVEMSSGGQRVH